jgi:hypothetical protein
MTTKARSELVERGQKYRHKEQCVREPAKVMAVADSYAMMRYPRAMPFVVYEGDLKLDWFRVDDADAKFRKALGGVE